MIRVREESRRIAKNREVIEEVSADNRRHAANGGWALHAGRDLPLGTIHRPAGPSRDQVGTKSALSRHQVQVLESAMDPQPITGLMELCGRRDRTKFRDQVIRPLLDTGLIEMTIPDKPTSSRQRYHTTPAGQGLVEKV